MKCPPETLVVVGPGGPRLRAERLLPKHPWGLVLLVAEPGRNHDSEKLRHLSKALTERGCGALILDLVAEGENAMEVARLNVRTVTDRVRAAAECARRDSRGRDLPLGLFGTGLGAAYTLVTASRWPELAQGVVAYGGRVDGAELSQVRTPTLLLVDSQDAQLVEINRHGLDRLAGPKALRIIMQGASSMAAVIEASAKWFEHRLKGLGVSSGSDSVVEHERSAIQRHAEAFDTIDAVDLSGLLSRIGDADVVLIGEASHGTSEFYRMRARITSELIDRKGFTIVAAEADWPDAERVDEYVRLRPRKPARRWETFGRFPSWMWRNEETLAFIEWLRARNRSVDQPERRAGFFGLDLYSLHTSMREVVEYLEARDEELALLARQRYRGLLSFQQDPVDYGRAALSERYASSENDVTQMLADLLERRLDLARRSGGGQSFFDAERNAAVVASAEKYYRLLFHGSYSSWNHRDLHMFETLQALLRFRDPGAKAVIWAHNSHVGDAACTEMKRRGETNLGELARDALGDRCFIVGFGTHDGTVAAASEWGGEMEIMNVRPSHPRSYERIMHQQGMPAFLLPLKNRPEVGRCLGGPRLERAIGVIYRPESELLSHYFEADLSRQFDEYVWFDRTQAVLPLRDAESASAVSAPHPFLLVD